MRIFIFGIAIISLMGCATGKKATSIQENIGASIEVIVNNMPTTDVGSKNYAIVTFSANGDTLAANWKLVDFTLLSLDKTSLFTAGQNELKTEFSGKGNLQVMTNVRNLPGKMPNQVIVQVNFVSDQKTEFFMESDPITPTVVQ